MQNKFLNSLNFAFGNNLIFKNYLKMILLSSQGLIDKWIVPSRIEVPYPCKQIWYTFVGWVNRIMQVCISHSVYYVVIWEDSTVNDQYYYWKSKQENKEILTGRAKRLSIWKFFTFFISLWEFVWIPTLAEGLEYTIR